MKQVHSIGVVCALLLLLGTTTPAGAGESPVYFEDPFFLDLDKDGTRSEGDVFFGPQIIVSFDGVDGEAIVIVDGLELIWGTNGTAVTPPTVSRGASGGAGAGPVYFEDPFFLDLDKDGTRSEGDVFYGPQIIVSFDGVDGEAIVIVDGLELIWGTNGTAVTPPTVSRGASGGAGAGPVYFEDPFFLDLDKDGTRSEGDVFYGPQIIVSFDGVDGEAIVIVEGLELIWGSAGTAVTPPTVTRASSREAAAGSGPVFFEDPFFLDLDKDGTRSEGDVFYGPQIIVSFDGVDGEAIVIVEGLELIWGSAGTAVTPPTVTVFRYP